MDTIISGGSRLYPCVISQNPAISDISLITSSSNDKAILCAKIDLDKINNKEFKGGKIGVLIDMEVSLKVGKVNTNMVVM